MATTSILPDLDIPSVDLWTFLFEREEKPFPDDKVIFEDADTTRAYTYTEVKETALTFGKGLKALWNWKKGDVLALFTPNCVDTPSVIWGALWAGSVVSPANPTYTVEELTYQLKNSGATAVVTQLPMLSVACAAAQNTGIPKDRIIVIGDERDPATQIAHFTSIRNLGDTSRYQKTNVDPKKDKAFLLYSSGTTGLPKGVMLSNYNILANVLQTHALESMHMSWTGGADGKGDKILAMLPFFHSFGLTCLIHQPMYAGYHTVVMKKFDIERFCAVIQRCRITYSYVVPPVILLLSKHPVVDKYDLSSVRLLRSGAAPLSQELILAASSRLKTPIKQAYGLTEVSSGSHGQPWDDGDETIGSVGKLLPNMEAKHMTPPEDGSEPMEVPVGEIGELYMRGPNIFMGYHENPEATNACLSSDGFFRTGDVGYQDKDGNFYITDRVKELIKYKGSQVAPAELEGILSDNDAIQDVAVIGVESKEDRNELPRAYVVRSVKSKTSGLSDEREAEKIVRWLASRVAQHKRLRGGVRFVDAIPKSVSGKILRRVLKDRAKAEDEPATSRHVKL